MSIAFHFGFIDMEIWHTFSLSIYKCQTRHLFAVVSRNIVLELITEELGLI